MSQPKTTLMHIPLSKIRHNPVALRAVDKESERYREIVDSVKTHGVLNAINVRTLENPENPAEPNYGLMDGLHRFTAAQDAGLESIPAQVFSATDAEVMEAQIIANYMRVETKPVDYTKQLIRMVACNPALTKIELAARLGNSVQWLDDRLSLDKLVESIKKVVDEGEIKLSNAIALSKLDPSIQPDYVDRAMIEPAGVFVPLAQKARKEYEDAKRKGQAPKSNEFIAVEKLQKLSAFKDELNNPTVGPALIAKYNLASPADAFAFAVKWALNADPDSVEAQKKKFDERLKLKEEQKAKSKAEREAKAAETAAAIELAPGIPLAV
jgi:ParB/RepB/Spo0J family partition protein